MPFLVLRPYLEQLVHRYVANGEKKKKTTTTWTWSRSRTWRRSRSSTTPWTLTRSSTTPLTWITSNRTGGRANQSMEEMGMDMHIAMDKKEKSLPAAAAARAPSSARSPWSKDREGVAGETNPRKERWGSRRSVHHTSLRPWLALGTTTIWCHQTSWARPALGGICVAWGQNVEGIFKWVVKNW